MIGNFIIGYNREVDRRVKGVVLAVKGCFVLYRREDDGNVCGILIDDIQVVIPNP